MSFWLQEQPLVLASGSVARRQMLAAAGIPLVVRKASVDEATLASTLLETNKTPFDIAGLLAAAKGAAVALADPDSLILSADQTLDVDGRLGMKPTGIGEARDQLLKMRGKTHQLHAAVHLRRGETVLWQGVESATLSMRPFSDAFLDAYVQAMGERLCDTVGSYELEALGAHLFERVEGDHETVLGLPLRPLLKALRELGFLLR